MSWAEHAAAPERLYGVAVRVPPASLLIAGTVISMLTGSCSPQGSKLHLAQIKKEDPGCFKSLWTSCLTRYWSHRERQRTMRLEICFAQCRDKKAHSTVCKLRPWSNGAHRSWQSCSSNYRMASFLLSTKTREKWQTCIWSHLQEFTEEHSDCVWSRIVAHFIGEHKTCQIVSAPSAWSTSEIAWNWEPWATDPELLGRELQFWNTCRTLTHAWKEDISLPSWCSHALLPCVTRPCRIRG